LITFTDGKLTIKFKTGTETLPISLPRRIENREKVGNIRLKFMKRKRGV